VVNKLEVRTLEIRRIVEIALGSERPNALAETAGVDSF
jgi:hypothetical protein